MAKRLQIGFEANLDKDAEMEIRVTPVDREAPDNVIEAAETIVAWMDMMDAQPGDGEADVNIGNPLDKIPGQGRALVNGLLRLVNKGQEVTFKGNVFIKVKS